MQTVEQKWEYFQMLLQIGFKEIDISFPSASDTEFAFTRKAVASAPSDVWLQVLCPCRRDLIRTTVASVTGASKVIISLYIASSDSFISTIFNSSRQAVLDMAVKSVQYTRSITKDDPAQQATEWNLMFSPEAFSDTDPEFAISLCEAVRKAWQPSAELPMILNLPATVEMGTPNTFADQVEIFCRGMTNRDEVVVSLHPHNDRGCAVAAAELGQMAGATRIEGCLFGNGERTGNVDLVTLALNLYSQGIDPKLNFSSLPSIRAVFEKLTKIPVALRAPYAGDAVFQAYSGSHQDAISKGFNLLATPNKMMKQRWNIPYLTIDPRDIGASYESIIRVNSQSGKGGIAWTLRELLNPEFPAEFQRELSLIIKRESETVGQTLSGTDIVSVFVKKYDLFKADPRIMGIRLCSSKTPTTVGISLFVRGLVQHVTVRGPDLSCKLAEAVFSLTGIAVRFQCHQHTLTLADGNKTLFVLVRCAAQNSSRTHWAAKSGKTMAEAKMLACLSAALVSLLPKTRCFSVHSAAKFD